MVGQAAWLDKKGNSNNFFVLMMLRKDLLQEGWLEVVSRYATGAINPMAP